MMDKLNGCNFLIEDDDLLKKYNTILDKVSADIKKNLIASLPIITFFSILKTKIKSHGNEVTDFTINIFLM